MRDTWIMIIATLLIMVILIALLGYLNAKDRLECVEHGNGADWCAKRFPA